MSDLVDRLRLAYVATDIEILGEAADEIERMNALIDQMIKVRKTTRRDMAAKKIQIEQIYRDISQKMAEEEKLRKGQD